MSLYDPGAHAKRRTYRFLPYHWRRFRRWADATQNTTASYGIIAAVCIVMAVATLVVIILPFILGNTPEATATTRGMAAILLTCAVYLMCHISWRLFR